MKIEKLSIEQVTAIYEEKLCKDFPKEEQKPLAFILKAMEAGNYECYGLMQEQELLSYAFFIKQGDTFLLDYFATVSGKRNQGLGAVFLGLLRQQLRDADCVIAEVEDPSFASSSDEKELQTRRYHFYLRNGFADTGVRASAFGVPFILIEMLLGQRHDEERVRQLYRMHYRAVLPEEIYQKAVRV